MKANRVPTHRELAFILYGANPPRGLWSSSLGRALCGALEHDAPNPGAAAIIDPLPRATGHSFIWACPRCGVRFVHTIVLPNPLPKDAPVDRLIFEAMRQLYLDVLYEMNRGRRLVLRWPLRSLPGFDNSGSAPSVVHKSMHGVLSASPPAS